MHRQYRLHIDIPLGMDEEEAIKTTKNIMSWCFTSEGSMCDIANFGIEQINYRLGHDEDRQKSNYLDKNENGHVRNKKTRINISG